MNAKKTRILIKKRITTLKEGGRKSNFEGLTPRLPLTGDVSAAVGRKVAITPEEVTQLTGFLRKIGHYLHSGLEGLK